VKHLPVSNDIAVEAAGEAVDVIFVDVQVRRIVVSMSQAKYLLAHAPASDLLNGHAIPQRLEDTHSESLRAEPGWTMSTG
jgi:hypothetical protein